MAENEEGVTDQGDGPEAGKGKEKEPNPLEGELKALRADLASKDKQLRQVAESEAYWHGQTEALTKAKPEAKAPDPDPESDDEVIEDSATSAVDAFSTGGIPELVKRGMVTKKAAKAMIEKEARRVAKELVDVEVGKITLQRQHDRADAEMVERYSDLQDENSKLFKRTQQIFGEDVKKDPTLAKSPGALTLAARVAKAELAAEAGVNGKQADESDRLNRIKEQAGGARTRGTGFDGDEADDRMSPEQKKIVGKFNAQGGAQITEEAYQKRAKAGVRMSARAAMTEGAERREVGDWG